jgi:hypothetical protein
LWDLYLIKSGVLIDNIRETPDFLEIPIIKMVDMSN